VRSGTDPSVARRRAELTQSPSPGVLYDSLFPPRARRDLRFYLPLMSGNSVLDVGCGTGALLHMAREAGHSGQLVGLDPDEGMLGRARMRGDIDWLLGDLSTVGFEREFDLVVMTGHAFQELLTDEEVKRALGSVASALVPGGRLAFETRNPAARGWERWRPENGRDFVVDGVPYRWETELVSTVDSDVVRYRESFTTPRWAVPRETLRQLHFVGADKLDLMLARAGFVIEERYGDWDRSSFTAASPEIITLASSL
jgi:SAM-dependent methyltransferase